MTRRRKRAVLVATTSSLLDGMYRIMRLCAVSVDLDEIHHYYAIHGLPCPAGRGRNAVYDIGMARLGGWATALGIPLTLFAVGSDLDAASNAERLAAMDSRGHEVANHTLDHLYDLVRRDRSEQLEQVQGGIAAVQRATGRRPSGFRAPGYTMSNDLYEVLRECGVIYGSSVFPCPAYYFAKLAKISTIAVRGRSSKSIMGSPAVLRAPTRPYRIGHPYWTRGSGVLELPIQVTRGLRLPFFGTTLTLLGPSRSRRLTRGVLGEPLINLELHGIDFLDERDGFVDLHSYQPDVSVPHGRKIETLTAVVELLKAEGYSFVRLDEAASAFA